MAWPKRARINSSTSTPSEAPFGRLGAVPERAARRLEVCASPAVTGFQVIALAPFVPRVDEDQSLALRQRARRFNCVPQPALISVWPRAVQDHRPALPARGVVPHRRYAGKTQV